MFFGVVGVVSIVSCIWFSRCRKTLLSCAKLSSVFAKDSFVAAKLSLSGKEHC